MEAFEGDTVELDKVLLIADDDNVTIGNPVVEGAKVTATCQGDKRAEKIIVQVLDTGEVFFYKDLK